MTSQARKWVCMLFVSKSWCPSGQYVLFASFQPAGFLGSLVIHHDKRGHLVSTSLKLKNGCLNRGTSHSHFAIHLGWPLSAAEYICLSHCAAGATQNNLVLEANGPSCSYVEWHPSVLESHLWCERAGLQWGLQFQASRGEWCHSSGCEATSSGDTEVLCWVFFWQLLPVVSGQ